MVYVKRETSPGRAFFLLLRSLFLFAVVLVAVFGVVGYMSGWVRFDHDEPQNRATIEIDTAQMKSTASEAIHEGKELLGETKETLQDLGRPEAEDTVPTSRNVVPATPEADTPSAERAPGNEFAPAPAPSAAPAGDENAEVI